MEECFHGSILRTADRAENGQNKGITTVIMPVHTEK